MPFIRHPNGGESMNGRTNTTGQVLMGLFIPLEPISDLNLVPRDSKCLIQWTDPVDKYTTPGDELVAQWQYTIVIRKENSAPTGPTDGVLVVKETTRNQYAEIAYEDTGLTNGTTYYYALYAYTIMNVANEATIDDVLVRESKPVFIQELTPTGYNSTFTTARFNMAAAGDYILIGGGVDSTNYTGSGAQTPIATVHSYSQDLTEGTCADLKSVAQEPGAGTLNGSAYFAGGYTSYDNDTNFTRTITLYDSSLVKNNNLGTLSETRSPKTSASTANYLFFAGGFSGYHYYGSSIGNRATYSYNVDAINTDGTIQTVATDGSQRCGATNNHAIFHEGYGSDGKSYCYNENMTKQELTALGVESPSAAKMKGSAMRVPVSDGSVVDLTLELEKKTTAEEINEAFRVNGDETLVFTMDPIVSSDVIGSSCGAVVDGSLTEVLDTDGEQLVKVVAWYDNEMGYSNQMVRTAKYLAKKKGA